jgi:hypothetical protein
MEEIVLDKTNEYIITYNELHNNEIIEMSMVVSFSKENDLWSGEEVNGFDAFECFSLSGRHILYVNAYNYKYCCIKSDDVRHDRHTYSINTNITRIYVRNDTYVRQELVFINSFEHALELPKLFD